MSNPEAGYQEVEHTADWQLNVWAPDFPGLLLQAALGMYALSGIKLSETGQMRRVFDITADDAESLLVAFLGELLYYIQSQELAFSEIELNLDGMRLTARGKGAAITALLKEIKAVTYHNLVIRQTGCGLETSIVFDV